MIEFLRAFSCPHKDARVSRTRGTSAVGDAARFCGWAVDDAGAPGTKVANSWINPFPRPGLAGYSSYCSKGRQTASGGTGVYIGTDNCGPAVPSGVFMSPPALSARAGEG